ncbi:MAG TPA: carboxypeptidase-like regulatory domain-containing protein [archaeon]|nr:carboxypeptidase-like regulatory domain-containing protein [archaeon]
MAQKGLYESLEEKYYSFLDVLEEKGIPVYKVVDALEQQNIPSFPVAVIFSVALVALLLFGISSAFASSSIEVIVQDSDTALLEGVVVSAIANGLEIDSKTTDSTGKAVLNVPLNSEIEIRATKGGFEDYSASFIAQKGQETKTLVLGSEIVTLHKTISFLEQGTSRVYQDEIEALFSCTGNDFESTQVVRNGSIDLEIESDCDTLLVKITGSQTSEQISLSSDEGAQVFVAKELAAKGSVVVTVNSSDGQGIAGVDVTLYSVAENNVPGSAFETKQTSASSVATFSAVSTGTYYIIAYDRSGNFAEYDGLKEGIRQQVRANEVTSFAIVMQKSVAGKIKLLLKDSKTSEPIGGAIVSLAKSGTQITTSNSLADGKVEFNVGEDVQYAITIDKPLYLIKNITAKPSQDSLEVLLEQATIENSESLLVTVTDEKDLPVENVKLKLKASSDGAQIGAEIVTGADGRAIFERVSGGSYFVYGVKPGHGEKTSETFAISNRQQNTLKLRIPIGSGKIEVSVVDSAGNPVAGAEIKAVDYGALQTLQEVTTDPDGKKEIVLRADKKVFLIVSADGFVSTTTVPLQMQRDSTLQRSVELSKDARTFQIEFEELYFGNELVSDSGSISPGSLYSAKFRLIVPANATFDEALAHIRTGKEQNNSSEKDSIYISDVRAAYSTLAQGATYNPPLGQAQDLQRSAAANSKWANVIFKKAQGGVYEIETDLQVRNEARIGSLLEIWYRAAAKSGGYIRSPNDAALGSSEGAPQKNGLYANALKKTFSIGPTSLCSDDFCASYSSQDLRDSLTSSVVDSISALSSVKYKLLFEISSISNAPFSAGQLAVKDRTSSIAIDSYNIKTASGENKGAQRVGSEFSVAVGEITKDSVVSGEIVFEAKKEGTIPIEVSLISASGSATQIYSKVIYVKVLPSKELSVDILPRVIVPLINNNILVRVTDGNSLSSPISNAQISFKKDGQVIAGGSSDIEGIVAFTLLSPSEGSTFGVSVDKSGYREVEKEIKITGNILATDPQSIKLLLSVGGEEFKTIDAAILNHSQIPLEIEKIAASKDFSDYVQINFTSPVQGTVLTPDGNAALSATLRLSEKALQITKPTRILGTVHVHLTNPNFSQRWLASIPLELTFGFGDELDSTECFELTPTEWKATGSPTQVHQVSITIINNCEVAGQKINLRNISARIVPGSAPLEGAIRATSSLDTSRSVLLDKSFRTILDSLRSDSEGTIKLELQPGGVVSSSGEAKIELQATHFTSSGEQKITRKIDFSESLNDLSQCVEVLTNRDITVQSCPYNTGFGQYGNRFSQFSNSRYAQFDPYASRNGYGTGVPPYLGSALPQQNLPGSSYYDYGNQGYMNSYQNSYYPNTSYTQPFYPAEGVSNSFNTSWNCGSGGFAIRNSCSSAVDLAFDPQPGINVKDKTITIEPNSEAEVVVEPTNFFGRYALGIKAKPSQSNRKTTDIRTVYVNVTNELAKNYKDCISISPSRNLSFNNFVGKPVELQIINTCYDQGVFLEASNNTINFSGTSIATPTNTASGFKEMIESWTFLDEQITPQANGKVRQVLTFEIVKALKEYQNKAPAAKFFEQNKFADVGNLRYFLTSGFFAAEGRTNLVVLFSSPSGGVRTTHFPVTVQDYWPLVEFAEQISNRFTTYGNPSVKPSQCINDDALNFAKIGELPLDRYSTSENGRLFKIDEKNGCGSADSISAPFNPAVFEKNGLRMTISHDGHEATISFDATNWTGAKTQFNESMTSKVTRVSPAGTEIRRFNVSFIVKADPTRPGGKTPIPGGSGNTGTFACTAGESGPEAYKKFGLHQISYDWRTPSDGKGVAKNACDVLMPSGTIARELKNTSAAPWFCDATQSSIALAQKAAEIKKVTGSINDAAKIGNCSVTDDPFKCSEESSKNSQELFRYVLKQSSNAGYFMSGNGVVDLFEENSKLKFIQVSSSLENDLKGKSPMPETSEANIRNNIFIINKTIEIMEQINSKIDSEPRLKGLQLVYEINGWDATKIKDPKSVNRPSDISGVDLGNQKDYAIPAIGFIQFQKQIVDQMNKCLPNSCASFTLQSGQSVSKEFMQELAKGKWKLTARNLNSSAQFVEELVMRNSEWTIGKQAGYNNFFEFHKANIDTNMFLIKDSYSADFAQKFNDHTTYKSIAATPLEFAQDKIDAAGDYQVRVEYNWAAANPKAKVSLKLIRDLKAIDADNAKASFQSQYANNLLFTFPVNGARSGAMSGTNTGNFYFNYYGVEDPSLAIANPTATNSVGPTSTFTFNSSYSATKSTQILSIGQNAIAYTPSDPVLLQATIAKGQQANAAGVLFEFSTVQNRQRSVQPLEAQWKVSSSGLGSNVGEVLVTQRHRGSALCSDKLGGLDGEYDGILINNSQSGTLGLNAVVFTPARVDETTSSEISTKCTQDSSTTIGSSDPLSSRAITSPLKGIGVVSLNRDKALGSVRTEYNLQSLVQKVNGGSVCVKADPSTFNLYWNEGYFVK